VEDFNVTLPDGKVVQSGLEFRNSFHLSPYTTCDLFVPCGGRPEAINLSNVDQCYDKTTKKPRFKVLVEGANLFLTQEARLILERDGVIIFKVKLYSFLFFLSFLSIDVFLSFFHFLFEIGRKCEQRRSYFLVFRSSGCVVLH
jgi:hypothetical protein